MPRTNCPNQVRTIELRSGTAKRETLPRLGALTNFAAVSVRYCIVHHATHVLCGVRVHSVLLARNAMPGTDLAYAATLCL
eukprot:1674208-Rhodomonas_salina.1